jgi:hypothetical protein
MVTLQFLRNGPTVAAQDRLRAFISSVVQTPIELRSKKPMNAMAVQAWWPVTSIASSPFGDRDIGM